jgi:hypothetical protein
MHENSYYKKEEGRPYSFAQVSVKKIFGKWINRSRLAKSLCMCPKLSKTVLMNKVKKIPTFLCFECRLW